MKSTFHFGAMSVIIDLQAVFNMWVFTQCLRLGTQDRYVPVKAADISTQNSIRNPETKNQ
jgi:hypothetical protein